MLNHARAGQEVFEAEIVAAGFEKAGEEPELLKENSFVEFPKAAGEEETPADGAPRGRGRGPPAVAEPTLRYALIKKCFTVCSITMRRFGGRSPELTIASRR